MNTGSGIKKLSRRSPIPKSSNWKRNGNCTSYHVMIQGIDGGCNGLLPEIWERKKSYENNVQNKHIFSN
jgi:hypothetical protein